MNWFKVIFSCFFVEDLILYSLFLSCLICLFIVNCFFNIVFVLSFFNIGLSVYCSVSKCLFDLLSLSGKMIFFFKVLSGKRFK